VQHSPKQHRNGLITSGCMQQRLQFRVRRVDYLNSPARVKNIQMHYYLVDVQKPTWFALWAFVLVGAGAIIPHSAKTCQVRKQRLLTLNRSNCVNFSHLTRPRKKAYLTHIK